MSILDDGLYHRRTAELAYERNVNWLSQLVCRKGGNERVMWIYLKPGTWLKHEY